MKNQIALRTKSTVVGLLLACVITTAQAGDNPNPVPANATNMFIVTGMHCEGCARGIASELKRTPGVTTADVSFSNKLAVVAYNTNRVSADGLKKVIKDAGYEAKLATSENTKRR